MLADAGVAALKKQTDFIRVGGTFGLSFGPAVPAGSPLDFVNRLIFHTTLQYGANVLNDAPDVDLFIASADWKIDSDGHYTATVEYRNGRSALVLQRDNRITVGLGVKY